MWITRREQHSSLLTVHNNHNWNNDGDSGCLEWWMADLDALSWRLALALMPTPSFGEVMMMERIDFTPAVAPSVRKMWSLFLTHPQHNNNQQASKKHVDNIKSQEINRRLRERKKVVFSKRHNTGKRRRQDKEKRVIIDCEWEEGADEGAEGCAYAYVCTPSRSAMKWATSSREKIRVPDCANRRLGSA